MTVIQYMEAQYCFEFPYMARGLPLGLQKNSLGIADKHSPLSFALVLCK